MARKYYEVGCGAVILLGALGFGVMYVLVAGTSFSGNSVYVEVELDDAVGLERGNEVMVAGVMVGAISSLQIAHDVALAELSLSEEAGLRSDVVVRVRSRSVLGEKYLELTPQSRDAPLLVDGDVLSPSGPQMEIDEMVNAIGPLVGAIDPVVLNETMAAISAALKDDPERLANMLENADRILKNTAAASEDFSATLTAMRGTMARANRTLDTLDARGVEAASLVTKADRVLDDLGAASEPLPELVAEASATLDELRAVIGPMSGAAQDLEVILEKLEHVDEDTIRRLLREDGVRVRLFGSKKTKKNRE